MEDFFYPFKTVIEFVKKKVSGKNDTITVAIFVFLLNCLCAEFILKYALTWKYVNVNF